MPENEQPAWVALFPDRDFRFGFGTQQGNAARFFAPTTEHGELLAERRRWIKETPGQCLLSEPAASPMIGETCQLARDWGTVDGEPDDLRGLGEQWEADIVLLEKNEAGQFVMRAGVVCFPSTWLK